MRTNNDGHSIWITAVNGDNVTFTDCNYDVKSNFRCQINWNRTTTKSEIRKYNYYVCSAPTAAIFTAPTSKPTTPTVNTSPTTTSNSVLEDHFYAYVKNTKLARYLTNDSSNVSSRSSSDGLKQIWEFTKDGNNGYKITSLLDNKALDVSGSSPNAKSNIQTYDDNGTKAQRWFITTNKDGTFTFKPGCSSNVLDLSGNSSNEGANIWIYTSNNSNAQKFEIIKTTKPVVTKNLITQGQTLTADQLIQSTNGKYKLIMQSDGNLVLYENGSKAVWSTSTQNNPGAYVVFQSDSNLVVYSKSNKALWASGIKGATMFILQDDRNFVGYNTKSVAVWHTDTYLR